MMARTYRVESGSVETVPVVVTAPADPTGGAVVFAFTSQTAQDSDTFDGTGSWSGSYDSTAQTATALTPTLPDAAAAYELAEGKYNVWIKYIVSSETVIKRVGVLEVD